VKPDYPEVRAFVKQCDVKQCDGVASAISRTEALGYHDLGESEAAKLGRLFELLTVQSITESVIDRSIELRRRRKSLTTTDAIVAATALELDASLATHNTADFEWIDELDVIDPVSDE
jgi:hypothetical protein